MSAAGAVLDNELGGLIGDDESCAFDALGNVWIGEAVSSAADMATLRYVAADGRILQTFQVPVGERGIDWIELDADQCTLYYTSEDSDVRRFDGCTGQALPNFATGLEPRCYALRQLPSRDLMVTCTNRIYRYDQNGAFIREYSRESLGESDVAGLYAVHLDPDGQTFWTGGALSGRVVRARLEDGSVIASFTTGTGGINGLLIQDEFVAGIPDVIFADDFEP
jgi:sugar lactone lactonase YvrE